MSSLTPDDDLTVIPPIARRPASATTKDHNTEGGSTGEGNAHADADADAASQIAAQPTTSLRRTAPQLSSNAHSSAGKSGNALPVGTYLGEFELTGVLGEGGFGIVYLAWDHSLERRVALKEYMPSALCARTGSTQVQIKSPRHRETFEAGMKSFVNEARLLASFDHPSLVKVYRFWEANGTAYMVMPFYEGITLKDKLRDLGEPPDEGWLMALLGPLTEALAVIHSENCFHRDIAPDNVILLSATGKPLLLDFGAARRVIGDMTQALTVILKPGYAPIEQYADSPDMSQGPWTDIYALAASVHYAIMGKTPPTSVSRLMNDTYIPLEQAAQGRYSATFLQAMDRALRVRPQERTPTVDVLRAELGLGEASLESKGDSTRLLTATASASAEPRATTALLKATTAQRGQTSPSTTSNNAKRSQSLRTGLGLMVLAAAGVGTYFALTPGKPVAPASLVTPTTPPAPTPVASALPVIAAPTPAPAVPATFDVKDEFDKVMVAQTPGFDIDARSLRSQLRIGKDALGFTVRSARDGFVQVLVLGPDGSALLMFPNAQASDNRIKAGQTLTLPKASWKLDTAEPAGVEHFLVIVSAQPRDYSELGKERDYIFLKLPSKEQGRAVAAAWTRSTPMLLGGLRSCAGVDCDAYGAAQFSVDIIR